MLKLFIKCTHGWAVGRKLDSSQKLPITKIILILCLYFRYILTMFEQQFLNVGYVGLGFDCYFLFDFIIFSYCLFQFYLLYLL